ncbi:MAG: polyphosphate polymerase domain-containing protein [Christensenellaceae bacterium]|nr:polyphosphate polymerase domain-containing protein [Christensenellaceae bacterium]
MEQIQHTFERIEKKYVLTEASAARVIDRLLPYMEEDRYGRHTIRNVYYDTPDYALIRHSVQKPVYKEKFRLRGYSSAGDAQVTFAELKKKYKGVVYKRRVAGSAEEIDLLLRGGWLEGEDAQTQREIHWFLNSYRPMPRVFIGYERDAFFGREDPLLRVTFDRHIRWREDRLTLAEGDDGTLVLPDDPIVMEVKIAAAAPLWMARMFSELGVYPTNFSKYGVCYLRHIAPFFLTKERTLTC